MPPGTAKNEPMAPKKVEIDGSTFDGRCAILWKKLREDAGLDVEQASELIGKSAKVLYDWESMKSRPSISMLPTLAKAYSTKKKKLTARDMLPEK